MTRHILKHSRSRLCGKLEYDIMNYCSLNPYKNTKGLRNLFRISFDKKFYIKRDRMGNIFSKADKKLSKIFMKKRSYYYNILLLKKRIRFFFGVISDSFIKDTLLFIFKFKRSIKGLKLMDAFSRSLEMRLDFLSFRLRYCLSIIEARSFISCGALVVNGVRIFQPFFVVKLGDIVAPFSFNIKALIYKSFYLHYFGEYIAKSGFLRGRLFFSLLKWCWGV